MRTPEAIFWKRAGTCSSSKGSLPQSITYSITPGREGGRRETIISLRNKDGNVSPSGDLITHRATRRQFLARRTTTPGDRRDQFPDLDGFHDSGFKAGGG